MPPSRGSVFGALIASGKAENVFYGYLFGAALMIAAGVVAAIFGVKAERQSLEAVAKPLSATDVELGPAAGQLQGAAQV